MAELDDRAAASASYAIPASTQLLAIAWLRWRIFANGFRRQQRTPGNIGGLIAVILLRVIIWPIFAVMALGPAFGAGFLAWSFVSDHHPERLAALLAGLTLLWQFVAINGTSMAATLSSFDPASLLRYPLRFGRYLVLRLILGLMTPSTIVGFLALLSAAIGIAVADVSLLPAALVVLAIYGAMNLFLARMVAAWMERWLATRRAREIFGALMALFFVSFQFLNFRRPAGHRHAANSSWLLNFMHGTNHFLLWLPPGFATNSIFPTAHPLLRLADFGALLAWTAAFFAAFAFRLHKQFLGEYLSEGPPRSAPAAARTLPQPKAAATHNAPARTVLSPTVAACLRKEWLYLRGNGNQLVSMLTPLIFVFILSRGMLARHPSFLLSGSVGYALMGPLATLYNIFGTDGAGVQLYLLAPVRLRDVIVAKNIASLGVLLVEAILAWIIVFVLATAPIPLAVQLSAMFWVIFVVVANLTLGTLRSIQSPRKFVPGKTPQMRTPAASRTTGLLVLALLLGSLLLEVPVTLLSRHFHNQWLGVLIFAPLAAAAVAAYAVLLQRTDQLVLINRDTFAEELCSA
jgi:ABC-2 type transport system permease protein